MFPTLRGAPGPSLRLCSVIWSGPGAMLPRSLLDAADLGLLLLFICPSVCPGLHPLGSPLWAVLLARAGAAPEKGTTSSNTRPTSHGNSMGCQLLKPHGRPHFRVWARVGEVPRPPWVLGRIGRH